MTRINFNRFYCTYLKQIVTCLKQVSDLEREQKKVNSVVSAPYLLINIFSRERRKFLTFTLNRKG